MMNAVNEDGAIACINKHFEFYDVDNCKVIPHILEDFGEVSSFICIAPPSIECRNNVLFLMSESSVFEDVLGLLLEAKLGECGTYFPYTEVWCFLDNDDMKFASRLSFIATRKDHIAKKALSACKT